jgi:hypothetical protein
MKEKVLRSIDDGIHILIYKITAQSSSQAALGLLLIVCYCFWPGGKFVYGVHAPWTDC